MNDLYLLLAEPRRRQILDLLRDGDRTVGELVEHLDINQSGVSRHLRLLREHGLVHVRPLAQKRIYRLNAAPLQDMAEWLEPYRAFWDERLDELEAHLDTMEDE